jgi:clan AA aspartic protease (TIGR02281 family)
MTRMLAIGASALAIPTTMLAYAALVGLGVVRKGDPAAVTLASTVLVFLPAVATLWGGSEQRTLRAATTQLVWTLALLIVLPVYFPGERRDAVSTGLSLLTMSEGDDTFARRLADQLPDEPDLAVAQAPMAEPVELDAPPPPSAPLADHEIALPYEGEGRRLSVPVVFDNGSNTVETYMMLDTGATYTTLSMDMLRRLGAEPGPNAPELTLSTANGERSANVVLLERVWLGDLPIEGVAVTTCDDCASDEHAGLLGLNVSGRYNITIDADRREVVFSSRSDFNRRLDVRPFAELDGRFTRYPGGRVEFSLNVLNNAPRRIDEAVARIGCGDEAWHVQVGDISPFSSADVERRLPRHPPCSSYQIELARASW